MASPDHGSKMPGNMRNVLVIDVGGTHVKFEIPGVTHNKFASGPRLTAETMVAEVLQRTAGNSFDAVSIGYPGPVVHGRIAAEPHNLGKGWVGFDFTAAFGKPVRLINDAAMQALGGYQGGRMLFLGLGTGLGSAMVIDGVVEPLELGHLPYRKSVYEHYVGEQARRKHGNRKWTLRVLEIIEYLRAAMEPDETLIGGGNALRLGKLPNGCRSADNANAITGGLKLWEDSALLLSQSAASPHGEAVPVSAMQVGMLGLGRMGANMVRRLIAGGHDCVVYDRSPDAVNTLKMEGARGADSLTEFVQELKPPRVLWMMLPAAAVDASIEELGSLLVAGDILIDGGNSYYVDDMRRSTALLSRGIHYVDVGTSGGVWGLERGYCMMIGGDSDAVSHLDPLLLSLAPGPGEIKRTPGRESINSTAEMGYLHCGPVGSGHFVKMVHNGIEYGLMAAYAEGLSVLRAADIGKHLQDIDAETTPLRDPQHYQFELDLREIAELWRRGSVISSWLLDLTATALAADPALDGFAGRVSDSGEGRWTIKAAIDEAVPVPVLTTALYERFSSRGEALFQDKLLSAMRHGFGGHDEKPMLNAKKKRPV